MRHHGLQSVSSGASEDLTRKENAPMSRLLWSTRSDMWATAVSFTQQPDGAVQKEQQTSTLSSAEAFSSMASTSSNMSPTSAASSVLSPPSHGCKGISLTDSSFKLHWRPYVQTHTQEVHLQSKRHIPNLLETASQVVVTFSRSSCSAHTFSVDRTSWKSGLCTLEAPLWSVTTALISLNSWNFRREEIFLLCQESSTCPRLHPVTLTWW